MDIATIVGVTGGWLCMLAAIIFGGGNFMLFFDPASIMIVVAGSFCCVLASNELSYILKITSILKLCFFPVEMNSKDMIVTLVSFSEKARREGLLALEDDLNELNDDFLKKGIQLVVDGTDPELVRRIMETELEYIMERHDKGRKVLEDWGFLAPAFGMLGTAIGLILMMANLEDKAAIGPGMATALITTLYGSLLANVCFIPMANKLALRGSQEILIKLIMIEGTLSIQAGDNPRIVRDKLVSFLEPGQREEISQEVGGD